MVTNLQCPRCHADALYNYGRIKNGKQRYLCLLCNRQFVAQRVARPAGPRPNCPLCNGKMHVYMRSNGITRYRCADYPSCRGYAKA